MGAAMSRWPGGAMGEAVPGARMAGDLSFEPERLVLGAGQGMQSLPLAGLRFRLGGANDALVLFEHPAHPGLTLFARGHDVLAHPALQAPAFAADLRQARAARRRTGLVAALALLALAL